MPYFQAFQLVSVTVTFFMNSITFVMNHLFSYFDISICHSSNRTLSYRLFISHGSNHGYILGGCRYIHLTKRTNAVFSNFSALLAPAAISMNPITYMMNYLYFYSRQRLPCIQMFPLKRLPIAGSPSKSFSLMQISNTISLHSIFIA